MLWAMYFLKCYPLTQQACAAAGGADGAIDLKTWKKYVWPAVYSIADLEAEVVSNIQFLYCISSSFQHIPF